jgi:radical SAM protein with 4Fe4S-binding SPASM domain
MLLQESVGNIKEQSFTTIWERSEVLMKLRDRNNLKGTCGNCINREKCGGARFRAYANGDIFNGDPECWIFEPQN